MINSPGNSPAYIQVQMDLFSELLGARPARELEGVLRKSGCSEVINSLPTALNKLSGLTPEYFFSEDTDSRFCTEVLFLKTILFLKIACSLKKAYDSTPVPFLILKPEHIPVLFSLSDFYPVPAKWGFRIGTLKISPSVMLETALPINLFKPAGEASGFYTAPEIESKAFSVERRAEFVITGMKRNQENTSKLSLTMKISGDSLKYSDYLKGDIVQVFLKCNDAEINDLIFWGEAVETPSKRFDLITSLPDSDGKIENILEKRVGSTFFETKITLYKRYSAACDIYSLGKIFLSTLLVNDQITPACLQEKVKEVVSVMDDSFMGTPSDTPFIENRLFSKLNEFETIFSKKNILYCRNERSKRENMVPVEIWREIMLLCFRLVTNIDGFSICPRKPDTKKERIESAYDTLISQVEQISLALKTELFSGRAQNTEILEAIREVQSISS